MTSAGVGAALPGSQATEIFEIEEARRPQPRMTERVCKLYHMAQEQRQKQ